MKRLYEKNELLFALLWIFLFCLLISPIRSRFGDESIFMLGALVLFVSAILIFISQNHLEEKYGLHGWPKNPKRYLYFIPMWILATGNLWEGISMEARGFPQFLAVFSMALVGVAEEVIFRGFLFRALLKKNSVSLSVVITSLTFGIGHILNLFAGQTGFETIVQIVFAVSLGFLFTMVFYKCGSLFPGILMHSMIDVFSRFGEISERTGWIYLGASIVISLLYCLYLSRLPSELSKEETPLPEAQRLPEEP